MLVQHKMEFTEVSFKKTELKPTQPDAFVSPCKLIFNLENNCHAFSDWIPFTWPNWEEETAEVTAAENSVII